MSWLSIMLVEVTSADGEPVLELTGNVLEATEALGLDEEVVPRSSRAKEVKRSDDELLSKVPEIRPATRTDEEIVERDSEAELIDCG